MAHNKQKGSSTISTVATEHDTWKEMEKGFHQRRGKKKGREKDDSTTTGGEFFKVFLPDQSEEKLKIPASFQEYLEKEPNRPVSLKGPSGNTWQVMLTLDLEGLVFTKGWKEFAHDHSLKMGHLLVFTYDRHSEFFVRVFNESGATDKSAFSIYPSQKVTIKLEEEGINVAGKSEVPASRGSTRKRERQVNDITENDTAPKRSSSIRKRSAKSNPGPVVATSKASLKTINSNRDEYSCSNKTRIISKDVPTTGTSVLKKFRQPVVRSQRRPVTEKEKNLAFERAKNYKSKYPFTLQVMMASYVYAGFFMIIPCNFVRKSLPRASNKMTLWDPQGKSWEVNYVYYNDRNIAAFSAGWGKFAIGNNLEKFDVCVFELFKENNIKVHIYRVVQEIIPLIRSSM